MQVSLSIYSHVSVMDDYNHCFIIVSLSSLFFWGGEEGSGTRYMTNIQSIL